MGQFKPMVKMMTTEPTVELKLKKGGHVNMKKGGMAEGGHKKMAMGGGAMDMMSGTPALIGRRAVNAPIRAPGKPSMASRRKAMMAKKKPMPAMTPSGPPMAPPPMKKGGKAEGGESKSEHTAEMEKMRGFAKELKSHKSKPASKGHKGLKTGGVTDGQGGYATGGVTKSNAGGYKAGGKTSKKAFAAGGTVDSGRSVAMPEGRKPTPSPVRISQLAGTYKHGGKATPAEARLLKNNAAENATAMRQAKVQSNMKYGSPKQFAGGGSVSDKEMREISRMMGLGSMSDRERKMMEEMEGDMSNGAYDAHYANEKAENEEMRNMILGAPRKLMDGVKGFFSPKSSKGMGSVTETEKSITVSPTGKKRGGITC